MDVERIKRVIGTKHDHCHECAEQGMTESSDWPLYRVPLSDGRDWHLCKSHLIDLYVAIGHHVVRDAKAAP